MSRRLALGFAGIASGLISLAVAACTSSAAPRSAVTLLVTNATCAAGQCQSLDILAFPSPQPRTPGGFWSLDLGASDAPQVCLTIPPGAKFLVIGGADTTTTTWTNALPLSLGEVSQSVNHLQAAPSTGEFVPAGSRGWSVTLPGNALPVPAPACTP
jgi:hypothetical protein